MAKSNQVVGFAQVDNLLTFTVTGQEPIVFNMDLVAAPLRVRAEVHGWKQRLSDKAAMARDPKTGIAATPKEKADAIRTLAEYYMSGVEEWNMRGTGRAGKRTDDSYIVEAVSMIQDISIEEVEEKIARSIEKHGITRTAWLKKVGASPDVASQVAILKYGDSDLDADALLED